jgi:hypothetical protein
LAVATITNVTSNGYSPHTHRVTRCRARRAIGRPIIRAKATCIEGIAAYGLKRALTATLSWPTPVISATESAKPHSGKKRGGAVGSTT